MLVGVGVAIGIAVGQIGAGALDLLVWSVTNDQVIGASCRQPDDVDYSKVGPSDVGPYAFEVETWRTPLGGRSVRGMVGAASDGATSISHGVAVPLASPDAAGYRCEWTTEGVTIIEPAGDGTDGLRHEVPADAFLGGR